MGFPHPRARPLADEKGVLEDRAGHESAKKLSLCENFSCILPFSYGNIASRLKRITMTDTQSNSLRGSFRPSVGRNLSWASVETLL